MHPTFHHFEMLDVQNIEIGKNTVFTNNLNFLVFREVFLVINKGWKGPDLLNILKVPEMSERILKSIPQASISNFKPIMHHGIPPQKNNQHVQTSKTKRFFPPLEPPYRAPILAIHHFQPEWKGIPKRGTNI